MTIDINPLIAELLYEHDTVIIPGLGAIVATYQAAEIDQVQGQMVPPTKRLSFNKNLSLDDGLLVNYAKEKYQVSTTEAQQAVRQFVDAFKKGLENREILEIFQVGRFYLDYEKELRFLVNNINFNPDSFGLPDLQVYPVIRTEEEKKAIREKAAQKTAMAAPATTSGNSTVVSESISNWFQRLLPVIIIATLAIVGLGIYQIYFSDTNTQQAANSTDNNPQATRINVSPSRDSNQEESQKEREPDLPPIEELDTDGPTPNPIQKSVKIAVGSFGNRANVQRLIRKISEEGYIPVTDNSGNLTRVMIELPYEDPAEIEQNLKKIRKTINKDARLMDE
ncbi:MAG: SPOR domain-containing protein [Saprospiraceae bacterium]|nr:SPOR domain-containing protein [Saprospiraceae bacterium]